MTTPSYSMGADDSAHSVSPQLHAEKRHDPALDVAHQHQHAHLHHSAMALKGRDGDDDVVYSSGTTNEADILAHQDRTDHARQRRLQTDKHADLEKAVVEVHDSEKGEPGGEEGRKNGNGDGDGDGNTGLSAYYVRLRPVFHAALFLVFTGWWIAGLVLHRDDLGWIVPFLVWLAVTVRVATWYVPISVVTRPIHAAWDGTVVRAVSFVPVPLRLPLSAAGTVAVFLVGAFASPESQDNTRANRAVSLFGLVLFLAILYATSRNRRAIRWHTVIVGMLTQFVVALFVLRTGAGFSIFNFVSDLAVALLGFAGKGLSFLTSDYVVANYHWFLLSVLPAIIFFVSFVQILYYWGWLQWFIGKAAVFFFWSMRVSGAEAVVASASPFVGQGESAMLIRPFIAHLTRAELHQVMCSGFATIAGSVLVAYIGLGVNPQALVSSCVMSIPASLAISKMRYPEEEETLTAGRVVILDDDEHRAANTLHAFANGAWLGLKIGGIIAATLLCIIALLGLVDGLLSWWGHYLGIPDLTVEFVLGYLCYPVAFLLGVSREGNDLLLVGRLIGTKIVANEFVAYSNLVDPSMPYLTSLSPRSKLIATYALCGFGNIGSLGNQIGVLSQLAPSRAADVSRLAVSALLSGVLSTLTSASIAGMLVTDEAAYISRAPASG